MADTHPELQRFRASIDSIDRALLELLAARFEVTQEVGEYKRDNDLPAVDPAREAAQFEQIERRATELGVNPDLARSVFRVIINEVVRNHQALRGIPEPRAPWAPPA